MTDPPETENDPLLQNNTSSQTDEDLPQSTPILNSRSNSITNTQNSTNLEFRQAILKEKSGYKFSLFAFFLCGVGNLLPWNFLITPKDYWMLKLETGGQHNQTDQLIHSQEEENRLQSFWENFLSLANMLPAVLAGFLTSFGLILRHSSSIRILTSLKIMLSCLLFNQIFIFINVKDMIPLFFSLTLFCILILSFGAQVFGCSVSGVATKFGGKHISMMLIGQAVAGILAAVANIFSILVLHNRKDDGEQDYLEQINQIKSDASPLDIEKSAFCFFLFAILLIAINLGTYYNFLKTEIYTFVVGNISRRNSANQNQTENSEPQPIRDHLIDVSAYNRESDDVSLGSQIDNYGENGENDEELLLNENLKPNIEPLNWNIFCTTIASAKHTIFQICLANFINLCLFPAVCSAFQPTDLDNDQINLQLYRSIWVFLNFNLGDCLGRIIAGSLKNSQNNFGNLLLNFMHISRVMFLLIIPICNINPNNRKVTPVLIHQDWVFIVSVFSLAVSNGFCMTVSFGQGIADLIRKGKDELVESAGSVFVLFISIGLFLGALGSFGVQALL